MSALAPLPAQGLPPRTSYVFNVYVDPNFGDDARALADNPGVSGNLAPLSSHPSATANGIGGLLQHAPFSFRTLTNGVRPYLDQLSALYGGGQLPWNMTNGKSVTWVVIHCLPGVYQPILPGFAPNPIDIRNGLRINGENWPFVLKDRESLQGTSALDTVLDARGREMNIIRVEAPNFMTTTHRQSFIDGVTIRGARSDGGAMSRSNATGAGILIGDLIFGTVGCQVTISNCFIVDNDVGLAVDSGGDFAGNENQPLVVNNTFARNRIGIWNGNRQGPNSNTGYAKLILLNNVIDSWRPSGQVIGGPFAGITSDDLTVTTVNGATSVPPLWSLNPNGTPPGLTFNAWDAGVPSLGPAPLANWLTPAPRNSVPYPKERVDLSPYSGVLPGTSRGALFVNDVLRRSPLTGAGVEYSDNDFRLAPMVTTTNGVFGLNPLVNNALYCEESPTATHFHLVQILFANGLNVSWDAMLGRVPGLFSPLWPCATPYCSPEDLATFHAWDWDCDGFGNRREAVRSGFPQPVLPDNPNPTPLLLTVDLGADEMDELILAGFIDGTRILSRAVPNAASITDHTRLFFLNVYTPGNSYPRPKTNQIRGRLFGWWPHVQQSPVPDNYTAGIAPGPGRWTFVGPPWSKPRFMRSLECDFSPHLYPDPHPQWAEVWELAQSGPDVFGAMPWWTGTDPLRLDNAYLYHNPAPGYPPHANNFTSTWFNNVSFTELLAGIVNPPGTGFTGTLDEFLHPHFPQSTLGPWLPCTASGGTTYVVGTDGLGSVAAGCPDVVPIGAVDQQWQGFRYNAQILKPFATLGHNVQTFLVVNGVVTAPPGDDAEAQAVTEQRHQPTVDAATRRMRGRSR